MVLIQTSVGWEQRGVATAAGSFMNAFGQTVGVAVFGTLFNSAVTDKSPNMLAHGIHLVFLVVFGIAVLNLIILTLLPSQKRAAEQQPA
ncbi:hypothetical protein [Gordoniibacillus kamchatkensis]|uniref:hypothetical protein n=1 Tax=Gordoniibacillus kamchatkensis TaxID=1590651 RepID=UPI001E615C27|nr:hypothetical protein [Paenibacillus sp. VKM B-2647]